jgi:hypothetical protein
MSAGSMEGEQRVSDLRVEWQQEQVQEQGLCNELEKGSACKHHHNLSCTLKRRVTDCVFSESSKKVQAGA